jgi:hypothetical protein
MTSEMLLKMWSEKLPSMPATDKKVRLGYVILYLELRVYRQQSPINTSHWL